MTDHQENKNTNSNAYGSQDWRKIFAQSDILVNRALNRMPHDEQPDSFFGLTADQVQKLYIKHKSKAEKATCLQDVIQQLTALSLQELSAIEQVQNVRWLARSGAQIMAERNQTNAQNGSEIFDRDARRESLVEDMQTLLDLGWSVEAIKEDFLNHVKFWPTYTPHPTKDKNDTAEKNLYIEQFRIAETYDVKDRNQAMDRLVNEMLRSRLTPAKKDTLKDETLTCFTHLDVYGEGMLDFMEDLQYSLDKVFGEKIIDLTSVDFHMDLAPRDWYAGDADGKEVSAPVLFSKRLQSALIATEKYINILDVNTNDKDNPLSDALNFFKDTNKDLQVLCDNIDEIENSTSSSDVFRSAREDFSKIFQNTIYKGNLGSHGPTHTKKIITDLREVSRDRSLSAVVRGAAIRAVFCHDQLGVALGRQEIRHNGEDLEVIFDNFHRFLVDNAIVAPLKSIDKFSDLPLDEQSNELRNLVYQHGNPKIQKWLLNSNNGWSKEILERFKTVGDCFNHNRMGVAIIAESKVISPTKQQVLAEAFKIKHMVHMPLNEDQETIKLAAENFEWYVNRKGRTNLEHRINGVDDDKKGAKSYFAIMDPQSDSAKQHGWAMQHTQQNAERKLISLSVSFLQPILKKIGTGMSYARGGIPPEVIPRLFLNSLSGKREFDFTGGKNLHVDRVKKVLKQMTTFASTTVQGRAAGMLFGTSGQVYDSIRSVVNEMAGVCLAIDKKIDPTLIAPLAVEYEPSTKKILHTLQEECQKIYGDMRSEESIEDQGNKRIDRYMDATAPMIMAAYTGVGARKAARTGNNDNSKTQKPVLTKQRAIGSNKAFELGGTLADGSYSIGHMLKNLHEQYKEGNVSREDIIKFANDDLYLKKRFSNGFSALASADYQHGYDLISHGNGSWWDVKNICAADNRGMVNLDELHIQHTKFAVDAIYATSFMEALLQTTDEVGTGFDKDIDQIITGIYEWTDQVNKLNFGEKTRKKYPAIDNLQVHAQDRILDRAIQFEVERRIDAGDIDPTDPEVSTLLYHIACASQTAGPINLQGVLDQPGMTFGARSEPVFDIIRKARFKPDISNTSDIDLDKDNAIS